MIEPIFAYTYTEVLQTLGNKIAQNKGYMKVGRGVPAEPEPELPMKCAEKKRSSLLARHRIFHLIRLSRRLRPTKTFSNGV